MCQSNRVISSSWRNKRELTVRYVILKGLKSTIILLGEVSIWVGRLSVCAKKFCFFVLFILQFKALLALLLLLLLLLLMLLLLSFWLEVLFTSDFSCMVLVSTAVSLAWLLPLLLLLTTFTDESFATAGLFMGEAVVFMVIEERFMVGHDFNTCCMSSLHADSTISLLLLNESFSEVLSRLSFSFVVFTICFKTEKKETN